MRTRFLNIDYFNHHTSDLNFPRVPEPHIDSSPKPIDLEELLPFGLNLSIPLEIERLSIDDALSSFVSDVIPQRIDIREEDFVFLSSQNRNACFNDDGEHQKFASETAEIQIGENQYSGLNEEIYEEKHRSSRSQALHIQCTEKSSKGEEKRQGEFKEILQFETPKLDAFQDEASSALKRWEEQIFFDVPDIKICLDMTDEDLGYEIPYPCVVSESVYSVQAIAVEYIMEQKSSYSVEDDSSVHEKICQSQYPVLEVNETGLECCRVPSTVEELNLLLEKIECEHWSPKETLIADGQELLGINDVDILECLSEYCPIQQCLDPEPADTNLMLEVDFLCRMETEPLQGDSAIHPETLEFSFPTTSLIQFQELQILDLGFFPSFEVFVDSLTPKELATCDQMCGGSMNSIGSFYESFVSHELALEDDTFISLPIPVLSDDIVIRSVSTVAEEILAQLKPLPPSASEVIYLDWHLLQENRCNYDICSSNWKIVEEIDTYHIDSEKFVDEEMVVIDFVLENGTSDCSNKLENREVLDGPLTDAFPSTLLKNKCQQIPEKSKEMAPKLFKSMSKSSDLEFYLNKRKSTSKRNIELSLKETTDREAIDPIFSFNKASGAHVPAEMLPQKWEVEVHKVRLSDFYLSLVEKFREVYMEILESDKDLINKHCPVPVVESLKRLSLPKGNLMDWIENMNVQNTLLDQKGEIAMTLVALYTIKQMAYYLCFYGIHATHLYVDSICRNLKHLRLKLSLLQSLIEDADKVAVNDITAFHPSLSFFKDILRTNISRSSSKILVVADKVFWWPLKRLLDSLRISFDGIPDNQNQQDACTKTNLDALLHSDCLLISYEYVTASLPLDKFSMILEYGGSFGSSRLSTTFSNLHIFPRLYFMKVELDDLSVPKALCEGVDLSQNAMEGISGLISSLHEDLKDQNSGVLKGCVPVVEKEKSMKSVKPVGPVETYSVPASASARASSIDSKQMHQASPDIIIIMNTQNCYKEMLISRRSSYQKILAMERRGAQVVEREMALPVDLIFSASMCLVWYDHVNIWQKSAYTDEPSSCVLSCIEDIATNVLMSVSFAFSSCILVFEGESRFLAPIMESSDGLYAAAASLGVDLQFFCSFSPELTDEIILSCIDHATGINRHLYPKMSESETLAESFLTKFPSINPLSAHAILSSGGTLGDFLEWSYDCRIRAIKKYHVSDESIALFSVLCKYGEQEEPKSGMTECSSLSSGAESGSSSAKIQSQRKKQKCTTDPRAIDVPVDDYFLREPLHQSIDGNVKVSSLSHDGQPCQSPMLLKNHNTFNEVQEFDFSLNDKFLDQNRSLDTSVLDNLAGDGIKKPKNVYNGEIIDLDDSNLLGESFRTVENSYMRKLEKGKNLAFGNSLDARRLSAGMEEYPDFPSLKEINSGIWSRSQDQNRKLEDIFDHTCIDSDKEDMLPLKTRGELLMEKTLGRPKCSVPSQIYGEHVIGSYCTTPLSKAIHSSGLQQGSPWTIEFLNKVKEKSRMHRESLQNHNATTLYDYYKKMGSITKRKSPSTLDGYRYQGGSSSNKTTKRKLSKQFIPPPSASRNEKALPSSKQTWTPDDKRAKQTLSFTKNGNETQSKLVWSDGGTYDMRKRLRY